MCQLIFVNVVRLVPIYHSIVSESLCREDTATLKIQTVLQIHAVIFWSATWESITFHMQYWMGPTVLQPDSHTMGYTHQVLQQMHHQWHHLLHYCDLSNLKIHPHLLVIPQPSPALIPTTPTTSSTRTQNSNSADSLEHPQWPSIPRPCSKCHSQTGSWNDQFNQSDNGFNTASNKPEPMFRQPRNKHWSTHKTFDHSSLPSIEIITWNPHRNWLLLHPKMWVFKIL